MELESNPVSKVAKHMPVLEQVVELSGTKFTPLAVEVTSELFDQLREEAPCHFVFARFLHNLGVRGPGVEFDERLVAELHWQRVAGQQKFGVARNIPAGVLERQLLELLVPAPGLVSDLDELVGVDDLCLVGVDAAEDQLVDD